MVVSWPSRPVGIVTPTVKAANFTSAASQKGSQPSSALLEDHVYYNVVVAMTVALDPMAHTPVFVKRTGLARRASEHRDSSANCALLYVAREVLDANSNESFHISLASMKNPSVLTPKHTGVMHIANNSALILLTEAALPTSISEAVDSEHYKLPIYRNTQVTRHKDI